MSEIIIKKLEYIKGIPVEMLDDAIDAGELRKGKMIGLYVVSCEDEENDAHLEILLEKDGQEKLIKEGQILSIEPNSSYYTLDEGWEGYYGKVQDEPAKVEKQAVSIVSKPRMCPTPRPI